MDKHVKAVGILYIVIFVFNLLIAAVVWGVFAGIGILTDDPDASGILSVLGSIIGIFLTVTALPSLIAGIGILKYQEWGRVIGLIVAVFHLFNFPFGTALGIYTFWALLRPETRDLFR